MSTTVIRIYRDTNAPPVLITFADVDLTGSEVEIVLSARRRACDAVDRNRRSRARASRRRGVDLRRGPGAVAETSASAPSSTRSASSARAERRSARAGSMSAAPVSSTVTRQSWCRCRGFRAARPGRR